MQLDKIITLVKDSQIIGKISPLCFFEHPNYQNYYLIYTKEIADKNPQDNVVYFGKIDTINGDSYLVNINNNSELITIKSLLKKIFNYSEDLEQIKQEKKEFNKKLELPKNLFENPYNKKITNTNREDKNLEKYKDIEDEKIKSNREYRTRLKSLYEDLEQIKPLDKNLPNTIFVSSSNEMGILLKSQLSTLRQLWLEYQLQYNEKNVSFSKPTLETSSKSSIPVKTVSTNLEPLEKEPEPLDISPDFDTLFKSLSNRINYINDYLDELRELKEDIEKEDHLPSSLSEERNKLRQEKKDFEDYKRKEQEKLTTKKEELQIHFHKFQTLVENFDKKIKEVK